jgi:quercetin dioxygenase-like cupin family protein
MISIAPKHTFTYDGATINVYHANKGEGLIKHEHGFSHATICHAGKCKVSLDGRSYIMDKNHKPLNLPANQWHEIEALEDETVFVNIFAEGKY